MTPRSSAGATLLVAVAIASMVETPSPAREWYVDAEVGRDDDAGTAEAPLRRAQTAVEAAGPGDVVFLGPPGAVVRESILFRNQREVTLDGRGVTLDGSDPLPVDGWETPSDGLRRLRLPRTAMDRHLLTIAGRTEHMGRTQSNTTKPFPHPTDLKNGDFVFVNDLPDDVGTESNVGWLYYRGDVADLAWSTRVNGVGFGGANEKIVVRNLAARRFLNDGFNIHGHAIATTFEKIDGYDCFDEGFSAHEDCTCRITDGRFWGCENAVADVNDSQTDYLRCEFSRSLGVDALLVGRRHSLVDCRIVNSPGSTALNAGVRGPEGKPYALLLERVTIASSDPAHKPRARINSGDITIRDCHFEAADVDTTGANVR